MKFHITMLENKIRGQDALLMKTKERNEQLEEELLILRTAMADLVRRIRTLENDKSKATGENTKQLAAIHPLHKYDEKLPARKESPKKLYPCLQAQRSG